MSSPAPLRSGASGDASSPAIHVRRRSGSKRRGPRGGAGGKCGLRDLGGEARLGIARVRAGAGGLAAGQAPLGGERGAQPLRFDRPAREQEFAEAPGSGARALVGERPLDRGGGGQAVAHQDGAEERVLLEDQGMRLLVDERGDMVGGECAGLDQARKPPERGARAQGGPGAAIGEGAAAAATSPGPSPPGSAP